MPCAEGVPDGAWVPVIGAAAEGVGVGVTADGVPVSVCVPVIGGVAEGVPDSAGGVADWSGAAAGRAARVAWSVCCWPSRRIVSATVWPTCVLRAR